MPAWNSHTCQRYTLRHELITLHDDLLLSLSSYSVLRLQTMFVPLLARLDQIL